MKRTAPNPPDIINIGGYHYPSSEIDRRPVALSMDYGTAPVFTPRTTEFGEAFIDHLAQRLQRVRLANTEQFCFSFPQRFGLNDTEGRRYLIGLIHQGMADGRLVGPTFIAKAIEFLSPCPPNSTT